jgi:hypothetical protein
MLKLIIIMDLMKNIPKEWLNLLSHNKNFGEIISSIEANLNNTELNNIFIHLKLLSQMKLKLLLLGKIHTQHLV